MLLIISLFLVLFSSANAIGLVDCEGLPDLGTLGTQLDRLVTQSNESIISTGVSSYSALEYTCQVQGTALGTYREVSVIMEYSDESGASEVVQFEMSCLDFDGNWDAQLDSFTVNVL